MKLKVFYLGLLSVVALSQAQGMDPNAKYRRGQVAEAQVKMHEHVAKQVEPHIDVATHGDPVTAVGDISGKIGEHPHAHSRTGTTVNHKSDDLNTRLGTKAAGATGPSAHEKLTDLLGIQGDVTYGASARGANDGNVGNAANNLAGSAIANEEAILRRLKAGINANAAVAVVGLTNTRTQNTAAGALHAQDFVNAAGANNLQDFLAELGW